MTCSDDKLFLLAAVLRWSRPVLFFFNSDQYN